jgi:hypothetical protein
MTMDNDITVLGVFLWQGSQRDLGKEVFASILNKIDTSHQESFTVVRGKKVRVSSGWVQLNSLGFCLCGFGCTPGKDERDFLYNAPRLLVKGRKI